jgi:hypothetical protein
VLWKRIGGVTRRRWISSLTTVTNYPTNSDLTSGFDCGVSINRLTTFKLVFFEALCFCYTLLFHSVKWLRESYRSTLFLTRYVEKSRSSLNRGTYEKKRVKNTKSVKCKWSCRVNILVLLVTHYSGVFETESIKCRNISLLHNSDGYCDAKYYEYGQKGPKGWSEDDIKLGLWEVEFEYTDRIHLMLDRHRWREVVRTEINFWGSIKYREFMDNLSNYHFHRKESELYNWLVQANIYQCAYGISS